MAEQQQEEDKKKDLIEKSRKNRGEEINKNYLYINPGHIIPDDARGTSGFHDDLNVANSDKEKNYNSSMSFLYFG